VSTTSGAAPPTGFSPPPYPHERLSELKARAVDRFGVDGLVDCSIGTPCDPPPSSVLAALAASGSERGYPTSPGSAEFRGAAARWLHRRFGVTVDADDQVAACVGTKELVASTAQYLRLRSPDRDTVLYPAVSYPTYAMGALLAGCRPVPVPELPGGGPDLSTVDKADAARALMVWTNSPSNPTGFLTDLEGAARWARDQDIPLFSDECYAEFTWDGPPRSVLECGASGVIAVHSLSKRSNLAGVRAGFYAGDPELVAYLVEVRRHAGLMVPGPVQAGAAVALDDDAHVLDQRRRYLERLTYLAEVLGRAGLPVELPAGGFYLWVAVPTSASRGGWSVTEALALESGMLVSPGEFYGTRGAGFVRVAAVQPMDRLELVAERLAGRDLMAAR
jgi:succinyldiaminopimelate transaminase